MTAVIVLPIAFAAMGLVVERGLLWLRWVRNRLTTLGRRGRRLGDLRAAVVTVVAEEVASELRADLATGHGDEPHTRPAAGAVTAEGTSVDDVPVRRAMAEGGT